MEKLVGLSIVVWSRREGFNAPSADYNSAALALSYTGLRNFLYHNVLARSPTAITDGGRIPIRPR